ncbi:pentatricopeptide repeat-containing protein mitochondrial-like, partial [Trifolium medium]|nr:pentatricopeptide repeat-containing protein mitochondrial-like [Trifolium medium]
MFKTGLNPTLVSLNTIVNGLCVEGKVSEALNFTRHMENAGYEPNGYTFGALVN